MHVPELASLERAEVAEHTLLHADTAAKDSQALAEKMTGAKWMCVCRGGFYESFVE